MTSTVTITPVGASTGGEVDRLGRPVPALGDPQTTVGRLVRSTSPDYQPVVDGLMVALWRLFLPHGTEVPADAEVEVDGRRLVMIDAPDSPSSPITGAGYVVLSLREVS